MSWGPWRSVEATSRTGTASLPTFFRTFSVRDLPRDATRGGVLPPCPLPRAHPLPLDMSPRGTFWLPGSPSSFPQHFSVFPRLPVPPGLGCSFSAAQPSPSSEKRGSLCGDLGAGAREGAPPCKAGPRGPRPQQEGLGPATAGGQARVPAGGAPTPRGLKSCRDAVFPRGPFHLLLRPVIKVATRSCW